LLASTGKVREFHVVWKVVTLITTVRPTDLYAHLLITFALVTDCLQKLSTFFINTENNKAM